MVLVEQGLGLERIDLFVVHDQGVFDSAICLIEQLESCVAGEVALLGEDAGGAVAEFVVGGAQVDHQVTPCFPHADHDGGGDHVECEFGGGACFHAGGAGDDFGTDG